ncbi:MAG: archaeal heat shock protein Hsp20 [Thermocladium sp.]
MSEFDDFDKWWNRLRKFMDNFETEIEKEMDELFRQAEKQQQRSSRKPNMYYYGFEITMGPDGKPIVREFGNVKPWSERGAPVISEDIEPLTDVFDDGDKIKVVMDMPGIDKDKIKIKVNGDKLIVSAEGNDRRYYKEVNLPANVDPSKAKATYRNGVLTIELMKKNGKSGFEIEVN